MKWALKLISIDTILEFIVAWLASTVKNQESQKSIRLFRVVGEIHDLTGQFLEQTRPKI